MLGIELPVGWFHYTVTYSSDDDLKVYVNGQDPWAILHSGSNGKGPSDGRLVLGRYFTDVDSNYASVEVDELIFWNTVIPEAEIQYLANQA